MKSNKRVNNAIDNLELFSSVILILLLILVLIGSLQYGVTAMRGNKNILDILFILGIEVAIVTIIGQWIMGRYEFINNLVEKYSLKGGVNNGINNKTKKTGSGGGRG